MAGGPHGSAQRADGAAAVATRPDEEPGRSVRAARRWFLILAPALAGVLAIVGAVADPSTRTGALFEAYAANPGRGAGEVDGLPPGLRPVDRRRPGARRPRAPPGSWLANVGATLAFLGITTIPGFLLADFYDSAIGQHVGVDGALAIEEAMSGMWALTVMASTGVVGLILCLPVAATAAWWAGLVPWWAPVAATAGIIGGFFVIGANVAGAGVLAAGFVVVSVALARMDRGAWVPAPSA